MTAKGGRKTLNGKHGAIRLRFSKPTDFNDPFECLPSLDAFCFQPDQVPSHYHQRARRWLRTTAKRLQQDIEENWFVTSLTKTDRNVRMWAQYGDDHKGIKIAFDLASSGLKEQKEKWMQSVRYIATKRIDLSRLVKEPPLNPEEKGRLLHQIATRKGRDWQHEEEVRWFLRDDDRQAGPHAPPFEKKMLGEKMHAFVRLPHACIKRVTVGYLSPRSLLQSVLKIREKQRASWEVAKTVLSLNSFQFDEELVKVD